MSKEQIEIFQQTIEQQLLGPGSDRFGDDNVQSEVIGDFPLKRYFTGILFPNRILKLQGEKDSDETNTDEFDDTEDFYDETEDEQDVSNEETGNNIEKNLKDDNKPELSLSNHFWPSNMGISFCVKDSLDSLEVSFSFAIYNQPKQTEARVKISLNDFHTLSNDNYGFPFINILKYEKLDEQNGYLSLSKELVGNKAKEKTQDYAHYESWKKSTEKEIQNAASGFNKIIGRLWKRKLIEIIEVISLDEDITQPKTLREFSNNSKAGYTLIQYQQNGRKYIKIQLVNMSEGIPHKQFSNAKEKLNESCLFQASVNIRSNNLLSYKPYKPDKNHADEEDQQLDFLYREVEHFSIGHNCSATWHPLNNPTEVGTTFLPTYDLKDTKTDVHGNDVSLKDLSIWGKSQQEVIQLLAGFVENYKSWIEQNKNDGSEAVVGRKIIKNLEETAMRLEEGVQLLKDNATLFRAFQYANTAMLLQFSLNKENYQQIQDAELSKDNPLTTEDESITYRPFQLAFLLLSLESTSNPQSKHRAEEVDLIWFPTGGGKTEAYLAVAALTMTWRRMQNINYQGVSVVMRYTLRLLTAQQFERASKLVVVLEYMRQYFKEDLKGSPISIGLWIGQSSTPNKLEFAKEVTKKITKNGLAANKFQIDHCPWCADKLIKELDNNNYNHAFDVRSNSLIIKCLNKDCYFSKKNGLPVQVVDEALYKNPPTLLFATVDKFAMLSWVENGHRFFNSLPEEDGLSPDLIIQDELHLLTGPLGSIVGLFETVIESLCTKNNVSPKVIASTATTRNTTEQVSQLYGNRKVNLFPPSGLSYDDSFFARQSKKSNRRYLGFMPTGKTSVESQIHLIVALFIARLKVFLQNNKETEVNPYWTLVLYYNSIKDVGRMSNKVGDEIFTKIGQVQDRLSLGKHTFNRNGLKGRTQELTSRIDSAKIKRTLEQLEQKFELEENNKGWVTVKRDVVDLVLATNMLSVGIDIDRLNIMQINGMPRNTAEYIQGSSRVARKDKGLVVTFFDSNRARDKSYFEHFLSFHQSLYKKIEPLSITPFTENTINKMIASLMVTYVRHKKGLYKNADIKYFKKEHIDDLKKIIGERFDNTENLRFCLDKLDELAADWNAKINQPSPYNKYDAKENALLSRPDSKASLKDDKWVVMQSMRDIDSNSFIQIQKTFDNSHD